MGLWDVIGGLQNVKKDMVLRKLQEIKEGKRWSGRILKFFRQRDFTIEWDSKISGHGKTNVGVPQGSLLSAVILLI